GRTITRAAGFVPGPFARTAPPRRPVLPGGTSRDRSRMAGRYRPPADAGVPAGRHQRPEAPPVRLRLLPAPRAAALGGESARRGSGAPHGRRPGDRGRTAGGGDGCLPTAPVSAPGIR